MRGTPRHRTPTAPTQFPFPWQLPSMGIPRQLPPHSPSSQRRHTSPVLYLITVREGPCDGTGRSAKLDIRCRGQKGAVGRGNSHEPAEAEPKPGRHQARLRAPTPAPPRPHNEPYRRSSQRGRACSPRGRQRRQPRSRSRPFRARARARPRPASRPSPASPRAAAAAPQNCITGPAGKASRRRLRPPGRHVGCGQDGGPQGPHGAGPGLHIFSRRPRLPQGRGPGRPPPLVPPPTPGSSWRPVWPSPPD